MFNFIHKYVEKEKDKGKTRDVHMFISPTEKIYVRDYFKRDSLAKKFRWETFEGNQLKVFIKAEKATWKGPPNNWELSDYEIRTFNDMRESIIVEKKEKLDTVINLLPSDFVRYDDTKMSGN